MWTLDQALDLIRDLQPDVRALSYHVTLGGGVLNTGQSEKDLDLWFIPLNDHESNPRSIMELLMTCMTLKRALRDGPDYGTESIPHAKEMQEFNYLGKRIDVFIQ